MAKSHAELQLWGGFECTLNRVGSRYFDQLEYSGHRGRLSDLERVSDLGLRTLRYPVIWEHSEATGALDFAWPDERTARMRELEIEPIVGLVHHGSGPSHTSLVSDCFPEKLAVYAGQVARRYPWVRQYTPVNEPLTTARFSGLYGHWHPHGRDDQTFVRALLIQCRAIAGSMAAIRLVNPRALLVQTEDMGFTRATSALRYQADFENERRWLSLDLLAGRVSKRHPLYGYLRRAGASERELGRFEDEPCPADIIGINYYVTSERFLDGRVELYPPHMRGGNGRDAYADVEAVRVCADGLLGPSSILEAAHLRFQRPLVVTEAHIASTPAQQAAWLAYVWNAALRARDQGADVRAVTVWALLGAYGWDRLVTEGAGNYEPGAFHILDGSLVQTDFGDFVQRLARGEMTPVESGWWTLPSRLAYPPYEARSRAA
jgi:dTDP-4-dehydrorhamnose reductase